MAVMVVVMQVVMVSVAVVVVHRVATGSNLTDCGNELKNLYNCSFLQTCCLTIVVA